MDLDELKNKLMELIQAYNFNSNHREIKPIDQFGIPILGSVRLYWANWMDDSKSSILIGLRYDTDLQKLVPVGQEPISLDEATENFYRQIEKIHLKTE